MRLYQLRIHIHGWSYRGKSCGMTRQGFTNGTEARRAYRRAVMSHKGIHNRITLHEVDVPDRLTAADWTRILSDTGIPDMKYYLLYKSEADAAAAAAPAGV